MTINEFLENFPSYTLPQQKLIREAMMVLLGKDEFDSDEEMLKEANEVLSSSRARIQTVEDLFALDLRQLLELLESERSGESAEIAEILTGASLDMDKRRHTNEAAESYRGRLQEIIGQFSGMIDEKTLKLKLLKINNELVGGTELDRAFQDRQRR